ncbi:MAG TPA: GIY-YIG nuclease family protein [Rhizomicrobium sp.]|nr:GIY-YIG nuclease family protein [Rhizomicrobium sp.]
MNLGGYEFSAVCDLSPERGEDGRILALLPQERYSKRDSVHLNRYGTGPFCKFKIPSNYRIPGVYALTVDNALRYIGECANFSARFNMGYGNISPKNCYMGGQQTNCRLNNLIYSEVTTGKGVALWFHSTADYKAIEFELRSRLVPPWNRI